MTLGNCRWSGDPAGAARFFEPALSVTTFTMPSEETKVRVPPARPRTDSDGVVQERITKVVEFGRVRCENWRPVSPQLTCSPDCPSLWLDSYDYLCWIHPEQPPALINHVCRPCISYWNLSLRVPTGSSARWPRHLQQPPHSMY